MFERILEQNCQTFDNFNFEFSMSHHNAHYQPYKKAPIFPSLYPLVCRFQNNNDVEMEVVIAKYLSRCDGRGALKIPSFYTHYEVNVNLIRIMFGF